MSLDPRNSQRRGRSKSPGRRREDDERSHSKVRAPSPPSSKYDYRDAVEPTPSRGHAYDYEDRSGRRDRDPASVVDAQPRGHGYGYDPRGSDPRVDARDPYAGHYRSEAPSSRPEYATSGYVPATSRPDYAMPGSFTSADLADDGPTYATAGGPGGREKDYYADKGSVDKYGDRYGKKDEYIRHASPSRKDRERSRYEDVSPPRKEKKDRSRYEDDSPPRKEKKDRSRYEDVSPPRKEKKDRSRYEDDSPPRKSKYESEKYEYESKRHEEDRYGKDKYKEDKYHDDKYGKDRYKDDNDSRHRAASFNITAGKHSFSGGVEHSHEKPQYVRPPSPSDFAHAAALPKPSYAEPPKWEYAPQPETISYSKPAEYAPSGYGARPISPPYGAKPTYGGGNYHDDSAHSNKSQVVTVEPGSRHKRDASPAPGAYRRDASPNPGLNRGMHSLSVGTAHHGSASLSLATAPGSPLLESYHGTYQSISPMPSPLMIANVPHNDVNMIEALSPESSSDEDERTGKKKKRSARFHDPEEEARTLASALKGEKRAPDIEPLIEILPGLTHEQVLDLRVEYKRIVKTGSEKKGVNIAKHIKLRLKEEDPSLMKACYACALGKWESEAYWANFWYQGEKSRRELLIESLMGRTNREIREIKDGFADKKYSDSLVKCMKTELKEDKFKKAVLLVLDEKKMEERPGHGLDRDLIEDDVRDLYKAVRAEKGGETLMINIVVVRSDAHLKEVLRLYESTYRANFAREMLKKSGNLVGEMLAHILNGVINKPVRDALLVHHALSLSKSDSIRTELLISRLVRYHWDRPHMEAVKREYRTRYGTDMQRAVAEGTRGDWGQFCEQLCVRRMGDEVRRVDEYRVERR